MKLGFSLPQLGGVATPEAVRKLAPEAERLGYHSVFVLERLLWPLEPQSKYLGTPDGSLPSIYQSALDSIETLTFAAAVTSTIRLQTAIMVLPYHQPVMLAKRLATLDVLSGGRLECGVGLGWSKDEYDTSGVSFRQRGRRMDELLKALKAVWTQDPVEFHGEFYRIPKSIIGPKPVQKPHPPIYVAGYTPDSLKRAVTLGNGWIPAGLPTLDATKQMVGMLRAAAQQAGQNPDALEVVFLGFPMVSETAAGSDRQLLTGTLAQIKEDFQRLDGAGVTQINLDVRFGPDGGSLEAMLRRAEEFRALA